MSFFWAHNLGFWPKNPFFALSHIFIVSWVLAQKSIFCHISYIHCFLGVAHSLVFLLLELHFFVASDEAITKLCMIEDGLRKVAKQVPKAETDRADQPSWHFGIAN